MRHKGSNGRKGANKAAHQAPHVMAPQSGLSSKQQKRDMKRAAKAAAAAGAHGGLKVNVPATLPAAAPISAYKRPNAHPMPYYSTAQTAVRHPDFLTPDSPLFGDVLRRCYRGFIIEDEFKYSSDFHERFTGSLKALESNTPFLKYDITQPGGLGTKIARTYVSRCVVGAPGITYKYLGLRIFAYPWTAGEVGATPETIEIGRLNEEMVRRSSQLLCAHRSADHPYTGSCQYNLTLINRFVSHIYYVLIVLFCYLIIMYMSIDNLQVFPRWHH